MHSLHRRRFYHQLVRQGCSSIAHSITESLLRLRKGSGSLLARYIYITSVFAVSGIFHTLSDISQGIRLRDSGAMRFFLFQAAGIMIENVFHAVLSKTRVLPHNRQGRFWRFVKRVSGHLWPVAWLVWTSLVWLYMSMQRDKGEPIIPF